MLASIKTMKLELEEWGRTLEEKVNKRTEELVAVQMQMAQSEKLASIGRLAAGVAHEINNPLGGILTFSMLALEDCDDDHPLKQSLEVIVKADAALPRDGEGAARFCAPVQHCPIDHGSQLRRRQDPAAARKSDDFSEHPDGAKFCTRPAARTH